MKKQLIMETKCKTCKNCPVSNDEKKSREIKLKQNDIEATFWTMENSDYCVIFMMAMSGVIECEGYEKRNYKVKQ